MGVLLTSFAIFAQDNTCIDVENCINLSTAQATNSIAIDLLDTGREVLSIGSNAFVLDTTIMDTTDFYFSIQAFMLDTTADTQTFK